MSESSRKTFSSESEKDFVELKKVKFIACVMLCGAVRRNSHAPVEGCKLLLASVRGCRERERERSQGLAS